MMKVSQHSNLGFPCHYEFFPVAYPVYIGCPKQSSTAVIPGWYFCSSN